MTVTSTLTQVLINFSKLIAVYHTKKSNLFHFRSSWHFCPLHDLYFILEKICSCSIKSFWQIISKRIMAFVAFEFTAQRPKIVLLPVCWLAKALFTSRIRSRLSFCVLCDSLLFSQPSLPSSYAFYLLSHPSFSLPSALLPEGNSYS